jgi:hypothetical protein
MDPRCPLGLKGFPKKDCHLAVERLDALKQKPGVETNVGCDWYIRSPRSHYCFFAYMSNNEGQSHETIDIARLLASTQASVYSSLTKAIESVREAGVGELLLGEDE